MCKWPHQFNAYSQPPPPQPLGIFQAFFCLTAPLTGSVFAKEGQHRGESLLKTNYLIGPIDYLIVPVLYCPHIKAGIN